MEVLGKKKKQLQTTKNLALHLKEQLQFILLLKYIKFGILFLKCVQKYSPIEETVLTVQFRVQLNNERRV